MLCLVATSFLGSCLTCSGPEPESDVIFQKATTPAREVENLLSLKTN